MAPTRVLLVWCPDWPVIAAEIVDGVSAHGPVAVLHANRVIACSEAARAEGVRRGLRRREAQHRCPRLTVVEYDAGRDARAFEQVVAAVEAVAAGVEVIRPGMCAVAARGPARYFGGEERAAERIVEQVAQTCAVECQVGVAEGTFAAGIAARTGQLVPLGGTRQFLAGVDIAALDRPSLVDLLRRLGVRTLGDFAALPAADVLSRFGFDAALAHRHAAGQDERLLAVRQPPADLDVTADYEEPLERVDVAAFAARALAERLHQRLAGYGLACTRLGIEAVTARGEELHRVWRHDGLLTATAVADRVRWQLDGWLTGGRSGPRAGARSWSPRPTAGIIRLRLTPDGVLRHVGLQPGLWGEDGDERARADRVLARVQGILGPESVVTAVVGGGRSPVDQVRLVPWGDERVPARPGAPHPGPIAGPGPERSGPERADGPDPPPDPGQPPGRGATGDTGRTGGGAPADGRPPSAVPPWPGRLPPPAPAAVLPEPLPARVYDAAGAQVGVSARLDLTSKPVRLAIGDAPAIEITGWAGPWPVEERWWSPGQAYRGARFQMALADGRAMLLSLTGGRWYVEAIYD